MDNFQDLLRALRVRCGRKGIEIVNFRMMQAVDIGQTQTNQYFFQGIQALTLGPHHLYLHLPFPCLHEDTKIPAGACN